MQKPFEYTMTSDERAMFTTWLVRIAAFYGIAVLIIAGAAVVGERSGTDRRDETVALATTGSVPSCATSTESRGTLCVSRKDKDDGANPGRVANGVTLPSGDVSMGASLP